MPKKPILKRREALSRRLRAKLSKRIESESSDLEDMLCSEAVKTVLAESLDEEIEF